MILRIIRASVELQFLADRQPMSDVNHVYIGVIFRGDGVPDPHFFGVGGRTPHYLSTPIQKFCLVPHFSDQSYATVCINMCTRQQRPALSTKPTVTFPATHCHRRLAGTHCTSPWRDGKSQPKDDKPNDKRASSGSRNSF